MIHAAEPDFTLHERGQARPRRGREGLGDRAETVEDYGWLREVTLPGVKNRPRPARYNGSSESAVLLLRKLALEVSCQHSVHPLAESTMELPGRFSRDKLIACQVHLQRVLVWGHGNPEATQ